MLRGGPRASSIARLERGSLSSVYSLLSTFSPLRSPIRLFCLFLMAFDDRPIQWLAPLAAAGILLAIALPIFRKLGISGWPLAGSLIITVILGLAIIWLLLNAVNIVEHIRERRSR